jgi:hypothetical protein
MADDIPKVTEDILPDQKLIVLLMDVLQEQLLQGINQFLKKLI